MKVIVTIAGIIRFMDENGMLEDFNLGIHDIYSKLTIRQQDEVYNYAETEITHKQVKIIREMAGRY